MNNQTPKLKDYLFEKYKQDERWIQLITTIIDQHRTPERAYHNWNHLEHLFQLLYPINQQLKDWESTLLAILFHDIIYDVTSNTNEADSAFMARKNLQALSISELIIEKTTTIILATKSHINESNNEDINYFLDADLAILGSSERSYLIYVQQIRSEYQQYTIAVYNKGRKQVLAHFLEMSSIFKTQYFIDLFEQQARINITKELRSLEY